jgi:hypothetical protein
MGLAKLKTEGGQGGKRGHSNMTHWEFTEVIKEAARIRRRREAKAAIAQHWKEASNSPNKSPDPALASGNSPAGQERRHR